MTWSWCFPYGIVSYLILQSCTVGREGNNKYGIHETHHWPQRVPGSCPSIRSRSHTFCWPSCRLRMSANSQPLPVVPAPHSTVGKTPYYIYRHKSDVIMWPTHKSPDTHHFLDLFEYMVDSPAFCSLQSIVITGHLHCWQSTLIWTG